ncbi:tyrosine-type recombinase/integrase [Mesorhizobium sp. M1396]|uniref:tyrosine-type recombinase/integrase n=1 Tax=Mesorhizobium sp. M1396 TaxID=2957095 RepID=UPI00333A64F7
MAGARKAESFGGLPKAWLRMVKRAGLVGVTPHTLRHSFASIAGDLGYSEPTIGAMLGHAAGSVTSRYIHHLDEALVAAADRVSDTIAEMMFEDVTADGMSERARAEDHRGPNRDALSDKRHERTGEGVAAAVPQQKGRSGSTHGVAPRSGLEKRPL